MTDPLILTKLNTLMELSSGSREIIIGIIDGPVNFGHRDFQESHLRTSNESQLVECQNADSTACIHGTFVTGMLCSKRGSSAPAICPDCEIIISPLFQENGLIKNNNIISSKKDFSSDSIPLNHYIPSITIKELAQAIVGLIKDGARIINLSLGLSEFALISHQQIQNVYDYAIKNNVIIIVSAGNQANIGFNYLFSNKWIIPVASCTEDGKLSPESNFGQTISRRGLMAPGNNITSTASRGGYIKLSGTSFATPFVTGTFALLWSIFPNATAGELIYSLTRSAMTRPRSIIPPLLDANKALQFLKNNSK
jgi:subtilisin family serine protease